MHGLEEEIHINTVSSWVKTCSFLQELHFNTVSTILKHAYIQSENYIPVEGGLLIYGVLLPLGRSLVRCCDSFIRACRWATPNSFIRFYLRNVTATEGDICLFGSFSVAGSVV